MTKEVCQNILRRIILAAFGYEKIDQIDLVYPKTAIPSKKEVEGLCEKWLATHVRTLTKTAEFNQATTIESLFEKMGQDEEEDEYKHYVKSYSDKKATIIDILCDKKFEREGKLNELNISLNANFVNIS